MKNQFRKPLQEASQSAAQGAGDAQAAVSGDLAQGKSSSSAAQGWTYSDGSSLAPAQPDVQTSRPRETPYPSDLRIEEQPTVKRPALADNAPLQPPVVALPAHGQSEQKVQGPALQLVSPGAGKSASNISPSFLNAPGTAVARPATQGPFAPGVEAFNHDAPAGAAFQSTRAGAGPSLGTVNPVAFGPSRSAEVLSPVHPLRGGGNGSLPPRNGSGGRKRKKRRKVPIWSRVVIGILLFLLIVGGGGFLYYEMNFAGAVNNIVGQQVQRYQGEGNPNAALNGNILGGSRLNILLLGSDTDQKADGSYLAQTDIVVTIDPATKTVGMLSIPRDFYVSVPGYGFLKLDEAYNRGGVQLSRLTIEQDFGISINYYAWVGLDGFIKVINTLGGVDVDVTHPIVDDNYPDDLDSGDPFALERLYIAPGPQHLDGTTALEYVRSRHADLVGDFGRSARQQQVLTALKSKLNNPDIFSKLSTIANELNGSVKTDMQLSDILKLMAFARDLDINKMQKLILGPPTYSSTGVAPAGSGADAGADVVFPNCSAIDPALQSMFQLSNSYPCQIGDVGGSSQHLASSTPTQHVVSSGPAQSAPLASAGSTGGSSIGNGTQSLGDSLGNSGASLLDGPGDLFGIRSLLDLVFMVAFEAPNALQL